MKLRSTISVVIVAVMLALPANVWACACCSNTGFYHIGSSEVGDHISSEMERLRFGRTASLYLTEAGLDVDARGITQPKHTYSLTGSMTSNRLDGATIINKLRLSFSSGRNSGTLTFELPSRMSSHSADIHDGKISPGGGPLLYKEWRFDGLVNGTGIFQPALGTQARAVLVLQGRGNACDSAEDFTYWRLDVKSRDAEFAFHGRFIRPSAQKQ